MRFFSLDLLLSDCDLVITAEGGLDSQTPRGKIPSEVARRARAYNVPVIALAGTIGEGAETNYAAGIHAYASIMQRPMTLGAAIAGTERLLEEAAEATLRMVMIGWTLARIPSPTPSSTSPKLLELEEEKEEKVDERKGEQRVDEGNEEKDTIEKVKGFGEVDLTMPVLMDALKGVAVLNSIATSTSAEPIQAS